MTINIRFRNNIITILLWLKIIDKFYSVTIYIYIYIPVVNIKYISITVNKCYL